jgi:hypothetical protein
MACSGCLSDSVYLGVGRSEVLRALRLEAEPIVSGREGVSQVGWGRGGMFLNDNIHSCWRWFGTAIGFPSGPDLPWSQLPDLWRDGRANFPVWKTVIG